MSAMNLGILLSDNAPIPIIDQIEIQVGEAYGPEGGTNACPPLTWPASPPEDKLTGDG